MTGESVEVCVLCFRGDLRYAKAWVIQVFRLEEGKGQGLVMKRINQRLL